MAYLFLFPDPIIPSQGSFLSLGRKSRCGRGRELLKKRVRRGQLSLASQAPKIPSFQKVTNLRKVSLQREEEMRTMRNNAIKQDTSVLIRGNKESVKEKDSNVESCRGQLLSAENARGPQAGGTCGTLAAGKAPCCSQKCSVAGW